MTAYPPAERRPVVERLAGREVHDPYRWLEDADSPATREWVAAQDELWRRHAARLPGRGALRARVAELADAGTTTAPIWRGARRFVLRQGPAQEHPVLYVAGEGEPEEALVDPVVLDPGGTTTLAQWQPDWEGRRLAFQLARGDERSLLFVLDVAERRVLDGPIDRCRHSPVAWLPGGEAFYYVRAAPGGPEGDRRVYLHRVGTPADEDPLVAGGERQGAASYGLGMSADGRWLVISAASGPGAGNDLWLADLAASPPERPALRAVQEGLDARTVADVGRDGRLYVVTTLGAPRGRLCVADPAQPGPERWRDLVPEDPEAVLAGLAFLDGPELERPLLLVGRIRHALAEVAVHDLAGGARLGDVPLPGAGSVGPLTTRPAAAHEAWFTYTDSVTPPAVHRWDARSGRTELWEPAPGAAAGPPVEAHRVTYASADGTPVRMVVLARPQETRRPRPAILFGYGGFGISLTPSYSAFALAWVEAGGVFATAHLRGGGEEGAEWHRAGRGERKQNAVDDLIAAAERLIADAWTAPDRLALSGESNGGLVAAAALTQRPDLFSAAALSAPLLDMARYERSGLGPMWRGEYGSADDPEQLGWLLAYSPYHRVRQGVDYPAVLLSVFDEDSRVDPLHARKMCAALQWASAGTRPILLRREAEVGHGERAAASSVSLAADILAFLAAHTGLEVSGRAGRQADDPAEGAP